MVVLELRFGLERKSGRDYFRRVYFLVGWGDKIIRYGIRYYLEWSLASRLISRLPLCSKTKTYRLISTQPPRKNIPILLFPSRVTTDPRSRPTFCRIVWRLSIPVSVFLGNWIWMSIWGECCCVGCRRLVRSTGWCRRLSFWLWGSLILFWGWGLWWGRSCSWLGLLLFGLRRSIRRPIRCRNSKISKIYAITLIRLQIFSRWRGASWRHSTLTFWLNLLP